MARPCATETYEPRQVRKEAAVVRISVRRRIPEPPLGTAFDNQK